MSNVPPMSMPPANWPAAPEVEYLSVLPQPRKPRVWTIYVTFVVLLIAMLAAAVGWVFVLWVVEDIRRAQAGMRPIDPHDLVSLLMTPFGLLPDAVLNSVMEAGAVIVPTLLVRRSVRQRLRLVKPRGPAWAWLIAAVGGIGYSLLFDVAMRRLGLRSEPLEQLDLMFRALGPVLLCVSTIVVGGLAPLTEELVFRGYIQTRLEQRHGALLAILISSVLFGIFHMDLVHGTFACGFGVYMGILAWRTGSIYPAIIAHAANNTFSSLASRFIPPPTPSADAGMLVGGAALAALGLYLLFRHVSQRPAIAAVPPQAAL